MLLELTSIGANAMALFNLDLVPKSIISFVSRATANAAPNRDLDPLLAQVPSSPILTGVNPDSSSSSIRSHTFSLLFNRISLAALSYAVLNFFTCLPHVDLLNLQGSPNISTRSLNKGLLFPLSRATITILAFKFLQS